MSSSRAPHAPPIPTPSSTRRVTNAPSSVSGPYAWRRCRHRTPSRTRSEKPLKRVPESRAHFARRVNHALDDPKLQKALVGAMTGLRGRGNADLTTTLPPVHIALFGIDKLVASLDDAVAVLRMLPRSGTGQLMTSYVNWITGPSRSADIEQSLTIGVHGPREMHCVILDNGREQMLEDPVFRDALTCIRCGACSNACPPFMAVSGHQFGHIYSGPIGLVLTPFHHGQAAGDLPQSLCTQCNACQEICPVDIPLPRQILEHRRSGSKTLAKKAMLGLWERPALADRVMRATAPLSPLLAGQPFRDVASS